MSEVKQSNIIGAWRWFRVTSTLVGMPVVFLLVVLGSQKFFFSATCYTAGWRCEYAIGATDGMVEYMGELLDANPDVDIVAKTRKR